MIPIEQRRLWRSADHPNGPQTGDCARACVASIFEVPYEDCADIDGASQSLYTWVKRRFPGLYAVTQHLSQHDERIGDHVKWPTEHHERGYWLAGIWSTRIPDREEFGCGCPEHTDDGEPDPDCRWCGGKPETRSMGIAWGLHMVVMQNAELAWDPHPERDPQMTLRFHSATTFHVDDPARLLPCCLKGACGEGLIDPADCYHRRACPKS